MPRPRRAGRDRRTLDPSQYKPSSGLQWMIDYGGMPPGRLSEQDCRDLWEFHKAALLAIHVERDPGTRPASWWRWDAPEPRDDGPEPDQLARLGVLAEGELARVQRCERCGEYALDSPVRITRSRPTLCLDCEVKDFQALHKPKRKRAE